MSALFYIQPDGTLLVQSDHEDYESARSTLLGFAEMVQRMDPIHIYHIRPISLWQASSLGIGPRDVLNFLRHYATHPVPYVLQQMIVTEMKKWGTLHLHKASGTNMILRGKTCSLDQVRSLVEITHLVDEDRADGLVIHTRHRAAVKRLLAAAGLPIVDRVGYQESPECHFTMTEGTTLRPYQSEAVRHFLNPAHAESGIVVLPCGAGKTLVGIAAIAALQLHALILTPSETSAKQWREEFLRRTTLSEYDVRIYSPNAPPAPITITTYQRVAARNREGNRPHLQALTRHPWGIVVYDEVHMLPAPLFRLAADLQGARRLGLTATLIREDGAETDVFSMIGPKCYEVPWKQLERAGYLSAVRCVEIHVPLEPLDEHRYQTATTREQHRIAALNEAKDAVVHALVQLHRHDSVLIIGHYLESLKRLAAELRCPLITGNTPQSERDTFFSQFRKGNCRCMVLSRVANMAVDLPNASVAIQVSGLFGSRQEEAQRLGRLLRPETQEGIFYSLVSQGTVEARTAKHRQMYLVEQGYQYQVATANEYLAERVPCNELSGMPEHG